MDQDNIRIMKALPEDAEEITDLIQRVHNNMEHKEWFIEDDYDFILNELKNGFGYKALNENGRIVGSFLGYYPDADSEKNLGREAGLSREELSKVVHMESAFVDDEYRGHRLQYRLMNYAESRIDTGKYRHLFTTVCPDNIYSVRNIEQQGYKCIAEIIKREVYFRRVYYKMLKE